VNKVYSDL